MPIQRFSSNGTAVAPAIGGPVVPATYPPVVSALPAVLYGPDGQPIRLADSDRLDALIGSYDSYLAASFFLPPFQKDNWINQKGFDTLDDMCNIAAVRGALNIIRDAVLYKGWKVMPAVNDQSDANYAQAAEMANAFEYALNNITDEAGNEYDFRQDVWEMLYAVHTGFHVAEIEWRVLESGPYAGKLGFKMLAHKPSKQIGFELDVRTLGVLALTSYTPLDGYQFQIPVEKCLRYTFAPEGQLPYGKGIGRAAYKHSWTLDFLYRFWNIALETFGSPFILAKAPAHTMIVAQKAIQAIRQGAAPVLPTGVEADLMEIAGGGLEAFKTAAEHHCQQIAYIYLNNTLTSGEGQRSGSLALGKVHQDTQEYGLGGRRRDIEQVINLQLARRWTKYNYGPDALSLTPTLVLGDWDESDMERLAAAFKTLIDGQVMHPAEDQIRQRMGLDPLAPDLKADMQKVWDAIGTPPATIPDSAESVATGEGTSG
jgi:hypothetical protein